MVSSVGAECKNREQCFLCRVSASCVPCPLPGGARSALSPRRLAVLSELPRCPRPAQLAAQPPALSGPAASMVPVALIDSDPLLMAIRVFPVGLFSHQ